MNASLHSAPTSLLQPPDGRSAPVSPLRVTHAATHTEVVERPGAACMRVIASSPGEQKEQALPVTMDTNDYNQVVATYSDALYRYVVKHVRDRDEAKDIVQESFLRLWMRLDRVAASGARSYLFTTAHNLIVDRSRRRKNLTRYDAWHEDVQTTQQPKAGLKDVIDAALVKLTPIQRRLILLRDLEGHTYEAITEITGLDMTKVKVYLFRARKAMQSHLGELNTLI